MKLKGVLMIKAKLPNNCFNCGSKKIKRSRTYRDMYFCPECGEGKKYLITREEIIEALAIEKQCRKVISFNKD